MKRRTRLWRIRPLVIAGLLLPALAATPPTAEDLKFVQPADARPFPREVSQTRDVADAPWVLVLADKEKAGRTARDQPVIYWYISKPAKGRVSVVMNDPAAQQTLFEAKLDAPAKPGVYKLNVADVKGPDGGPVKLKPEVVYEVAVAVTLDKGTPPNSRAGIQRVDPKRVSAALLKAQDPVSRVGVYGRAGLWFDYLDALKTALEAEPGNDELKRAHAVAMEEQGIRFGAEAEPIRPETAQIGPAADTSRK